MKVKTGALIKKKNKESNIIHILQILSNHRKTLWKADASGKKMTLRLMCTTKAGSTNSERCL